MFGQMERATSVSLVKIIFTALANTGPVGFQAEFLGLDELTSGGSCCLIGAMTCTISSWGMPGGLMVAIIMASGVRMPYMALVICVSVAVLAAAFRIESIERKMQRPSRNSHLHKSKFALGQLLITTDSHLVLCLCKSILSDNQVYTHVPLCTYACLDIETHSVLCIHSYVATSMVICLFVGVTLWFIVLFVLNDSLNSHMHCLQ